MPFQLARYRRCSSRALAALAAAVMGGLTALVVIDSLSGAVEAAARSLSVGAAAAVEAGPVSVGAAADRVAGPACVGAAAPIAKPSTEMRAATRDLLTIALLPACPISHAKRPPGRQEESRMRYCTLTVV